MTMSGLPSAFMSTIEPVLGELPAEKSCLGAKTGGPFPAGVMFSKTDITESDAFEVNRSGRPSPFKSPTMRKMGFFPVGIVLINDKSGSKGETVVEFSSTETVLEL